MKKYFSKIVVYNFVILLILYILFKFISITIIPLVAITFFGGIAVLGILTAKFENISMLKNLKSVLIKILLNYLFMVIVYNIMLLLIFHFTDIIRIFTISIIFSLETILPYGITLILKYKQI